MCLYIYIYTYIYIHTWFDWLYISMGRNEHMWAQVAHKCIVGPTWPMGPWSIRHFWAQGPVGLIWIILCLSFASSWAIGRPSLGSPGSSQGPSWAHGGASLSPSWAMGWALAWTHHVSMRTMKWLKTIKIKQRETFIKLFWRKMLQTFDCASPMSNIIVFPFVFSVRLGDRTCIYLEFGSK